MQHHIYQRVIRELSHTYYFERSCKTFYLLVLNGPLQHGQVKTETKDTRLYWSEIPVWGLRPVFSLPQYMSSSCQVFDSID